MTPRVAMERMKTPSSPASPAILSRSPKMAPPEKGLDGSMATVWDDLPRAPRLLEEDLTAFEGEVRDAARAEGIEVELRRLDLFGTLALQGGEAQ